MKPVRRMALGPCLKRIGGIGVMLLLLNEVRGALVVAGVLTNLRDASYAGSFGDAASAALIGGLKCAALFVCR